MLLLMLLLLLVLVSLLMSLLMSLMLLLWEEKFRRKEFASVDAYPHRMMMVTARGCFCLQYGVSGEEVRLKT